jgi:hypothetical protein
VKFCTNQLTDHTSRHHRWDAFGRLRLYATQVGVFAPTLVGRYGYDAGGVRVLKVRQTSLSNYIVTAYIGGIFEHTYKVTNNTPSDDEQVNLHLLDGTSRLSRARFGAAFGDPTPDVIYEVSDHLGSSGVQLDENGSEVN